MSCQEERKSPKRKSGKKGRARNKGVERQEKLELIRQVGGASNQEQMERKKERRMKPDSVKKSGRARKGGRRMELISTQCSRFMIKWQPLNASGSELIKV